MADTYEQNLSQKGTLTVNDYIRVVGSDNVSYKQSVPEVTKTINSAQPTSSCGGSIKDWAFSTNGQGIIGTDNNTTDLPSASNLYGVAWTKNFVINTNHWVNLYWSPTNVDDLYVCANRNNTTAWTAWEKMPTRAEVDELKTVSQSTLTKVKADLTFGSQNRVYRYGRIVFVTVVFSTSTNASQNDVLFTTPHGIRYPVVANIRNDNGSIYLIGTDEELTSNIKALYGSGLPAGVYRGTFTYLATA